MLERSEHPMFAGKRERERQRREKREKETAKGGKKGREMKGQRKY